MMSHVSVSTNSLVSLSHLSSAFNVLNMQNKLSNLETVYAQNDE